MNHFWNEIGRTMILFLVRTLSNYYAAEVTESKY